MDENVFKTLDETGFVLIKNDLSSEEVAQWKSIVPQIKKKAILDEYYPKKESTKGSNIFSDDEEKFYLWKSQNILQEFDIGKKYIDRYLKILQNIHPNMRFIKDRFMNQKKNYQGHLPHQDNSASGHRQITDRWYTVYTSLTNTDIDSGCIWIEDIPNKRTDSLGMCDEGCAKGKSCSCINIKVMPFDIANYKGYKMKPVELKEGDTIIFDGWVLHGTAANLSDTIRQTLMFTYGILRDEDLDLPDVFQHYHNLHTKLYS